MDPELRILGAHPLHEHLLTPCPAPVFIAVLGHEDKVLHEIDKKPGSSPVAVTEGK